MAMTSAENYRKVLNGEWGEWVPFSLVECPWVIPSFYLGFMASPDRRDMFGVPWAINASGPMPDTTQPPVIESMDDWRDTVHLPDLDAIDWEAMAARDLAAVPDDHVSLVFTCAGSAGNFFLPIMAMLGFENGLVSFYESPEAVKEFCEYMTEYYLRVIDLEEKYYDPEIYCVADDLCSLTGPFISMEVYEEFFRPYYKQLFDRIKSYGKKIEFHLCGKGEVFIEDMMEMGLDIWQSAETVNDYEGLKAKYGDRLIINGGWSAASPANFVGADEETCRQATRDAIDRLVGIGPSMLFALVIGQGPEVERQNAWIVDEAAKYGREVLAAK